MVFNLLMFVLLVAIVYFHFLQGAFSALISAVVAFLAACIALGLHENIVVSLLGGKMIDYAVSMSMIGLFALTYLVLRLMIDKLIPGNVRLPVTADRIAAVIFGIAAGTVTTGILSLAAQALPTGTYTIDFSRFATKDDRTVAMNLGTGNFSNEDIAIAGELESPVAAEATRASMWLPVDSWTLSMVGFQSESGALAGPTNFRAIHPDFIAQQALARTGAEAGQKITTLATLGGEPRVSLNETFILTRPLQQVDGEIKAIRSRTLDPVLKPTDSQVLLVIRLDINSNEADKDELVRFSPGAVRLVAGGKDIYPLGTLEDGKVLVANAIDDPIRASHGLIDLVYLVEKADLVASEDLAVKQTNFKPDVFVEFRRLGRLSLSDKPSTGSTPGPESSNVRRKVEVKKRITDLGL